MDTDKRHHISIGIDPETSYTCGPVRISAKGIRIFSGAVLKPYNTMPVSVEAVDKLLGNAFVRASCVHIGHEIKVVGHDFQIKHVLCLTHKAYIDGSAGLLSRIVKLIKLIIPIFPAAVFHIEIVLVYSVFT